VSRCCVEIYFDRIRDKVLKYIITTSQSFADFIDCINVAYDSCIPYGCYANSKIHYRQIAKKTILMTLEFDLYINESILSSLVKVLDTIDVYYKIENYQIEYAVSNDVHNKFFSRSYYVYAIKQNDYLKVKVSTMREVLVILREFYKADLTDNLTIPELEMKFNTDTTFCVITPLEFKEELHCA
jgi:hypothetical protein